MSDVSLTSARAKIEALLLNHPDVVSALLVHEEGPDGKIHPVAYVVPNNERVHEAKKRIHPASSDRRIVQWKKAFDQVYRFVPGDYAPTFAGWTSSYTNSALPEAEMHEWLDCTINHILSLKPERVLEIGCGVGLLVQELAPKCSAYYGIDLSPIALDRLGAFVASKPELRHVKLFEGEAINLDGFAPNSVDTVLINSVAQYFPDIDYLRSVIGAAARIVSPGGHIFIGDVRHLGLLPMFHSNAQLAKAPSRASAGWLKRRILLAIEQDRELVIDPQFFRDLVTLIPRISSADVLVKRGLAHNELTRYRYDVVLRVDDTALPSGRAEAEWQSANLSAAEIGAQFKAQLLASVEITNIPNGRLARDLEGMQRLWSADEKQLVEDIRSPSMQATAGIDPEDFWKLSEVDKLEISIGWSSQSITGDFDVFLSTCDRAPISPIQRAASTAPSQYKARYATDPLEAAYKQQLALELQQRLGEKITEPPPVLVINDLPTSEPSWTRRTVRTQ